MYFYKFVSMDFEEQYAFELTPWKKFGQTIFVNANEKIS